MSVIRRNIILTGARAGMTGLLDGKYKTVNGVITLIGSAKDVEALTLYLGRMYQAFPEGSVQLEAANGKRHLHENPIPDPIEALPSDVQPGGARTSEKATADLRRDDGTASGCEGLLSEGNGHQHSRIHRIAEALKQLDTMNDAHWTADGRPACAAVESIIGDPVTRAEIAAAAPNFNREGK